MPSDDTRTYPRLVQQGPFFAQLWETVLYDPNLKSTDKVVYAALQRFAAEMGSEAIFPSQEVIAQRIHMNREAVGEALKTLVTYGHITRSRTPQGWVVTINEPARPPKVTKPMSDNPTPDVGKPDRAMSENPASDVGKPDIDIRNKERDTENDRERSSSAPLVLDEPPQPFDMWEAFCDATGQDYKRATTQAKGYALRQARRLIEDGVTIDEVRRYSAYLSSQTWRSDVVVKFADVSKGIGEWRMSHEPPHERPRATLGAQPRHNDPGATLSYAEQLERQGR